MLLQRVGISCVTYCDDSEELQLSYPKLIDTPPFDWVPYRRPQSDVKHDEVAATPSLVAYTRRALGDLFGRNGFDVYDVHSNNNLLTQEFDSGKLSGTTDAVVAPYGVAIGASLLQARLIIDFKTPEAMEALLQQLRYDLANKGESCNAKSGQVLAQFCCGLAKSNTYAPVVFTDGRLAIVLKATADHSLHFDIGLPMQNLLGFVRDHLTSSPPKHKMLFEVDLVDDCSHPIELMRQIKKHKVSHPLLEQLYGECGLLQEGMHFHERLEAVREIPNLCEFMYM
jgi:hypothetical protein